MYPFIYGPSVQKFTDSDEAMTYYLNTLQQDPESTILMNMPEHLNAKAVKQFTEDEYWNELTFNILTKMFGIYFRQPNDIVSHFVPDKVRSLFQHLDRIGSGSFGEVYAVTVNNVPKVFAMKTINVQQTLNKFGSIVDDLYHEYQVALFGLNNLRQEIPNFNVIMGHYVCSAALTKTVNRKTDIVLNNQGEQRWCTNGLTNIEPVNYIVTEYLDGVTFENYINSPGVDLGSIVNIFYQTLLALAVANDRNGGFTHFDLHVGNVMVRDAGAGANTYVTYKIKGRDYYLRVYDKIAVVIDYGMSHLIVKQGNQELYVDVEHNPPRGDNSQFIRPEFDLWMLLHTMILVTLQGHNTVPARAIELSRLGSFFPNYSPNILIQYLSERARGDLIHDPHKHYFMLKPNEIMGGPNIIQEFVDWSLKQLPAIHTFIYVNGVPTDLKPLNCTNLICRTRPNIIRHLKSA